ncbi:unnamed protein product [Sphacelaria rigidula]
MHAELNGHGTAGTFSSDEIPKGVNANTAKWVFSCKTDADGPITKAKARPACSAWIWPEIHYRLLRDICSYSSHDINKIGHGRGSIGRMATVSFRHYPGFRTSKNRYECVHQAPRQVWPLNGSIYGFRQAGRQWSLLLNKSLMEEARMSQREADPCVYKQEKTGREMYMSY